VEPRDFYGPFRVVESVVLTNAGAITSLIGENYDRVAILFSIIGASDLNLSVAGGASATRGLRLLQAQSPVLALSWEQYGPLVGLAWTGFTTVAANVTIVEVVRDRDPMRVAIEDRSYGAPLKERSVGGGPNNLYAAAGAKPQAPGSDLFGAGGQSRDPLFWERSGP